MRILCLWLWVVPLVTACGNDEAKPESEAAAEERQEVLNPATVPMMPTTIWTGSLTATIRMRGSSSCTEADDDGDDDDADGADADDADADDANDDTGADDGGEDGVIDADGGDADGSDGSGRHQMAETKPATMAVQSTTPQVPAAIRVPLSITEDMAEPPGEDDGMAGRGRIGSRR